MCDCEVKLIGKLGKPLPAGVLLIKRNAICYVALSFENDRDATAFYFGEHHTPQEVAESLRRAAGEIEAKDSGQKMLSHKKDFFFHHS